MNQIVVNYKVVNGKPEGVVLENNKLVRTLRGDVEIGEALGTLAIYSNPEPGKTYVLIREQHDI